MAILYHGNPYTHEEHRRESRPGREIKGGCDWCGQAPRTLYNYDQQYRTGGGLAWVCNRGCSENYRG